MTGVRYGLTAVKWVIELNERAKKEYGENAIALEPTYDGKYTVGNVHKNYIIAEIANATELTDDEKNHLLYDLYGITEDDVYEFMNS